MNDSRIHIYGKHAVHDAILLRPDVVLRVYASESSLSDVAREMLTKRHIPITLLNTAKLPQGIPKDAVHQGCVAEIESERLVSDYDDFMRACDVTNDTAFVVLGEVQDPHNVGAVIRSAAAFGIRAVLIPEHRQVQMTGTVIKVSVGAVFRIPMVRIANINQTLIDLKKKGFWIYGLEGAGPHALHEEGFEKPSVLLLGNESDGIRSKTREHCDILLNIPTATTIESLNASVAAGIAFYAWSRKHPKVLM